MPVRPEDSVVVGLAVIATLVIAAISVIVTLHKVDASGQPVTASVTSERAIGDAELIRCRDLGMPAAEDESCLAAWAAERQRFLGTVSEPAPSGQPPADGVAEEAADGQTGMGPRIP